MSVSDWSAMNALVSKINQLDVRVFELEARLRAENFPTEGPGTVPMAGKITKIVGARFPDSVRFLNGTTQRMEITTPRHIAMYLLRNHSDLSLPAIGRLFKRHHTSVLHAVKKIAAHRESDTKLDCLLKSIESEIRNGE